MAARTAWLTGAAVLGGCAVPPVAELNSDIAPMELRSRLDASFHPGMTLPEVNAELDRRHVSQRLRRAYAGDPPQLLVRLGPVGGFWVDNAEYQEWKYVDAWFVFSQDKKLERVDTENKKMRMGAGQYLDPPFHTLDLLPTKPREVVADAKQ